MEEIGICAVMKIIGPFDNFLKRFLVNRKCSAIKLLKGWFIAYSDFRIS